MAMIIGKVYPDGETYSGAAKVSHTVLRSLRTDSASIENNARNIVSALENKISECNGIILQAYVWVEEKTYVGVPILEWNVDVYYYTIPALIGPGILAIPWVANTIYLTVAGIVIWLVLDGVKEVAEAAGPARNKETGEYSKNPNKSTLDVMSEAISWLGPALLGFGAYQIYQTYQKTKQGGYNGIS